MPYYDLYHVFSKRHDIVKGVYAMHSDIYDNADAFYKAPSRDLMSMDMEVQGLDDQMH